MLSLAQLPPSDADAIHSVLSFWLGKNYRFHRSHRYKFPSALWFGGTPDVDAYITERFGEYLERIRKEKEIVCKEKKGENEGMVERWEKSVEGKLALIVLTDQMSRNVYRGTGEMFSFDGLAYDLAIGIIESSTIDYRKVFSLPQRVILYFPLLHSENLAAVQLSFQLIEEVYEDAKRLQYSEADWYRSLAASGKEHFDIFARFGRYPHRNALLGRESSAEEAAFVECETIDFMKSVQKHPEKVPVPPILALENDAVLVLAPPPRSDPVRLLAFGSNAHGQLGVKHYENVNDPSPCQFEKNPSSPSSSQPVLHPVSDVPLSVTGGGNHSIVVSKCGSVWVCGLNEEGQLGLNSCITDVENTTPSIDDLSKRTTLKLSIGGPEHPIDHCTTFIHLNLPGLPPIRSAACGWSHSLLLDDRGSVYSFGSGQYGQLGLGTQVKNSRKPQQVLFGETVKIRQIAAGMRHSAAVDDEGGVWMWGSGKAGQLGLEHEAPESSETGEDKGKNGKRRDPFTVFEPIKLLYISVSGEKQGIPPIRDISCGAHHTAMVSTDGRIFSCGQNRHGQLGRHPTITSSATTCARTDSTVDPPFEASQCPFPIQVPNVPLHATAVRCGWGHTAALFADGTVWSWGRSDRGQTGRVPTSETDPKLPGPVWFPFPFHPNDKVVALVTGSEHTLATFESGECAAWGWNEHGNCGTGDDVDVVLPTRIVCEKVEFSGSGYGHSFVYVDDDDDGEKDRSGSSCT